MQEETGGQEEVSLRDYLDLLRRRGAIIVETLVAALVIGLIVALISRPVYQSAGSLLVTPQNQVLVTNNASDPFNALFNNSAVQNIETQLQVLTTPDLMAKAYIASGQQPGDPRISVNVFNEKDQNIIKIVTEAHTPKAAADVTNNLMNLYKEQSQEARSGDLNKAIQFAERQLHDANVSWSDSANALQAYENRSHVIDLDKTLAGLHDQITALDNKRHDAQAQIAGDDAAVAAINQQIARSSQTNTSLTESTNPQIAVLSARLVDLDAQRRSLLVLYKDDNPKIKAVDAEARVISDTLRKAPATVPSVSRTPSVVVPQLEDQLRKLTVDRVQAVTALARVEEVRRGALKDMSNLGNAQFGLAKLIQSRDLAQDTVKSLSTRLTDLHIRQNAQASPITTLGVAQLMTTPVRPKRGLMILFSAVAGLFLGVCFALLQEFMDDRINAADDARRLIGAPALGYIPNIEREDQRLLGTESTGGSILESYRVLRSNVRFAAVGEPMQTIMVTSTTPGEGKSLTAANLAIAMALDGKKVILVDADLRRPTAHEKFGLRNTPGLTNVLVGTVDIDRALQPTDVENLKILTSGPIPPNPAEMLNSRAMEQVQESLKERADVVIFDSPPCLSVADAQVLAATVDGVIYVVQLGSTKKSALRHGTELLRQARARILGVVYNKVQVNSSRNDYYYGYYSYYHKAELPAKSNGNGHASRTHSEWDELTAHQHEPSAIAVVEPPQITGAENEGPNDSGHSEE